MKSHVFSILAIFAIFMAVCVSLFQPLLGLFIIGGVLVGGIALLVYRWMKL